MADEPDLGDFDTTPTLTADEAAKLAADLDAALSKPMVVLLDGLVRELSSAHDALIQAPANAGEGLANKYFNAMHHVIQARAHLRGF